MIFWMSMTAMGSTPAKGSSRRIRRGSVARARAISQRRRSPPDRKCVVAKMFDASSSPRSASEAFGDPGLGSGFAVQHRLDVLGYREFAETLISWGIGQAGRARWWIGRWVGI